jgi:succinate dehydrogenase / fumarate reductase cytochrome b subunit
MPKSVNDKRPLSPHVQIYKPQITSFTSILHRITGVILYLGIVMICAFISYYTYQINIIDQREYKCDCIILKTLISAAIFLWSFALYYHLCNGIRHLFWDIGKGLDINIAKKMGILVLVASVILTIASFSYVYFLS